MIEIDDVVYIYGARCVTNSSAPSEVSVRTLWLCMLLDAMSIISSYQ